MQASGIAVLLNRLARDGYVLLAVAFLALRLFQVPPWDQSVDAYAYWTTRDGDLYDGQTAGAMGAYLYSPAFAQLIRPLTILPWPVFVTIWTAFNLAIVWWLLGRWSLPAMLFIPIPFEIVSGNVHLMYAAAIVLGLPGVVHVGAADPDQGDARDRARLVRGAPRVAPARPRPGRDGVDRRGLVRPRSGAVAAVDRRHRRVARARPTTVGWYLPVSLLVRLPIALVVAAVAGLTGRAWLLPIAVTLALPVLWLNSLAILAACVPLSRVRVGRDAEARAFGMGALERGPT